MTTNPPSENLRDQFGKPRAGGSLNIVSIGEDQNKTFRVLPPMKSLRDRGAWGVYHRQHYGYGVRDSNDETKVRMRPFACVEETDDNGLVKVSCAECRKIEQVEQQMKDAIALESERLRKAGTPPEKLEALAKAAGKEYADWLQSHNLDRKWYIPVMFEDNSFGFLRVPHAAYKAIDKARKKLAEDENGADFTDIDAGVWIKLGRTGTFRTTEYDATIVKEATVLADGKTRATVTKTAPLSDDQLRRALELPDPTSLVRRISLDQVRMLAEGSGSPDEVQTILNLSSRTESSPEPTPAPRPAATTATPRPQVQAQTTTPAPRAEVKTAPPPVDDEETRLLAQIEAVRAAKAAKAAAAAKAVTQTVAADEAPPLDPDIDDDTFAARFDRSNQK